MKQPTEEQIAEIKAQAIGIAEGWAPMRMRASTMMRFCVSLGNTLWTLEPLGNFKDGSVVLLNPSSTKGSSRVAITESMR